MDGNEKNLSARREGIGDPPSQKKAGVPPTITKTASKSSLNLASMSKPAKTTGPTATNAQLASTMGRMMANAVQAGKKRAAEQAKAIDAAKKVIKENGKQEATLKEMMQRMNKGELPDTIMEETNYDDLSIQEEWEESNSLYENTDEEMANEEQVLGQEHDTMDIEGNSQEDNNVNKRSSEQLKPATDFVKASSLVTPVNGSSAQKKTTASRYANPYPGSATDPRNQTNVTVIKTFSALPQQGQNMTTRKSTENTGTNITSPDPNIIVATQDSQKNINVQGGRAAVGEVTSHLKIAPGQQAEEPRQQFFTYTFQLTFQEPLTTPTVRNSKKVYNVPENFRQFFHQLRIAAPDVLLQPYNDSGTPISHETQLPQDDIDTYNTYYHNHALTPAGHLTGMCVIMLPHTWSQLKNSRTTFFKWLQEKKVFMKYTTFKADQLSAAGWFYDLHPDVVRKDEVIQELRTRLEGILPNEILFQLAPRYLRVADQQGSKTSFNFRAIAVECDRKNVKTLQEALYQLGNPKEMKKVWPITGRALFVPFLATEAWQHHKILGMAKVQEKEMSKLGQLFLNNVQNIDKQLQLQDGKQASIREILLNLHEKEDEVIHSVHNTNREGIVSLLYYKEHTLTLENSLRNVHKRIEAFIHPDNHDLIATPATQIELVGRQSRVDSSQAKIYATYADAFLENPQGGEEEEELELILPPLKKQARTAPPKLSYSTVVAKPPKSKQGQTTRSAESMSPNRAIDRRATPHKLYDGDTPTETDSSVDDDSRRATLEERFQDRFDQMEKHFEERFGKIGGISIEETETKIQESHTRIQNQLEKYLDIKLQEFTLAIKSQIAETNRVANEVFKTESEAAQERLFHRFEAMLEKNNALLLQSNLAHEQKFNRIFGALGIDAGTSSRKVTAESGSTMTGGEAP